VSTSDIDFISDTYTGLDSCVTDTAAAYLCLSVCLSVRLPLNGSRKHRPVVSAFEVATDYEISRWITRLKSLAIFPTYSAGSLSHGVSGFMYDSCMNSQQLNGEGQSLKPSNMDMKINHNKIQLRQNTTKIYSVCLATCFGSVSSHY
jgi:hypothetical protein